jgi:hypothetical protein
MESISFTNRQLEKRLAKAEQELERWKPIGPALRRQGSNWSMRSISRREDFSCPRPPAKNNGQHLDLQSDFTEWLMSPPLNNLRIDHRLERRCWSLEQLAKPILSID